MAKLKDIKNRIKKFVNLGRGLLNDKRTPLLSKLLLWLAIGYALLPFDIIPDFIPVLGYLDDAIIVPCLMFIALRLIPKQIYEEHHNRIFNKKIIYKK